MANPSLRKALAEKRFILAPGVFDMISAKIADGSITAAKIADGSITAAKLGAGIPAGMAYIPGGTYTQGNSMAADTNIPDAAPVSTTALMSVARCRPRNQSRNSA